MELNRIEIYRMLLAEQLDLLDDAGRERLHAALIHEPELDRARFMEEVRRALGEDDAAMLRSLQVQERKGGALAGLRRRPRIARFTLIAAACAAFLWFGGRALLRDDRAGPADVVTLGPARGGAGERVDLDSGAGGRIALDTGPRPPEATAWQLRNGAGDVLRSGSLAAGRPGDPIPPVQVEKSWLRPAQAYWLVLLDDRQRVVAEWRFETR